MAGTLSAKDIHRLTGGAGNLYSRSAKWYMIPRGCAEPASTRAHIVSCTGCIWTIPYRPCGSTRDHTRSISPSKPGTCANRAGVVPARELRHERNVCHLATRPRPPRRRPVHRPSRPTLGLLPRFLSPHASRRPRLRRRPYRQSGLARDHTARDLWCASIRGHTRRYALCRLCGTHRGPWHRLPPWRH
jgi:hypothetical protein